MIQLARWLQGKYRKFEVRFLNPCKPVMRQGEKRATCISLPVGASTIRLRLKPTISLNQGTGFAFSAYDNPMLIQRILGMVGRDTPSDSIVAKRVRFRKPDGSWSDDLEAFATQRGSHIDAEIPLRKGSRLSLEIDYEVSSRCAGWDGVLGIEVLYESNGNNEQAFVNSKAFVQKSNVIWKPLTFLLRRVAYANPNPNSETQGS
jgi:hypothetical protein